MEKTANGQSKKNKKENNDEHDHSLDDERYACKANELKKTKHLDSRYYHGRQINSLVYNGKGEYPFAPAGHAPVGSAV